MRTRKIAALSVGVVMALLWFGSPLASDRDLTAAPAQPAAQKAMPPAPQLLSVNIVRVKPEMLTEWQEFQRNETIPALKKGGTKAREAWTTAVFGESYEYVLVTPIESLAQYDGDSPIIKALGQQGAAAYGAKLRRFVASSHTIAMQTRPDLSYFPNPTATPRLALVSVGGIAQGRNADFDNLVKNDVLPAMKKAQVKGYFISQVIYGGDVNEFVSLVAYDTFADIGRGHPFVRALGEDGAAKLNLKASAIVTRLQRSISRFVPELSFITTPTSSN